MKRLAFLLAAPIACFGNNSGKIDVTATVEFYANIQNAPINMTVDDYTKSQTVTLQDWSIWSNSSKSLAIEVSSVNGGDLKDSYGNSIQYQLYYIPCGGGDPINVTPTSGNNAFGLMPDVSNQNICASSPGSLEFVRPVLSHEPFAGSYTADVVMTVSQTV